MSPNDRARQFLPFDALKGLREAIRIKEIEHERILKRDIDPDKATKISNILISLEKDSKGKVIYFEEGFYYELNGIIKLDIEKQSLIIDKKEILLENIFDILLE